MKPQKNLTPNLQYSPGFMRSECGIVGDDNGYNQLRFKQSEEFPTEELLKERIGSAEKDIAAIDEELPHLAELITKAEGRVSEQTEFVQKMQAELASMKGELERRNNKKADFIKKRRDSTKSLENSRARLADLKAKKYTPVPYIKLTESDMEKLRNGASLEQVYNDKGA